MEQADTRDRITAHCIQEAIAVQDMLVAAASPGSLLKRINDRIRSAILPKNGAVAREFPATPSPAHTLFDPSAAGSPFKHWYESEQQPAFEK